MSSSLSRARSLRKPTQGSTTDLPATSSSSSTGASNLTSAGGPRNASPSRLPAPRTAVLARPVTRTVSSGSLNDAAAKKKKPNPISSLLSRTSTRQTPAASSPATSSASVRQRDVSSSSSASRPATGPLTRSTAASSGLSRTSSTREPAATGTRRPAAASGSAPSRPTTSGGVPAQKRTATASSSGPGHARARSVATLNNSTVLRPPSQSSTTSSVAAPRSRPTSMYGAPPSTATSTSTAASSRTRPTSSSDRLAKPPTPSSPTARTRTSSTASKQPPPKPQPLARQAAAAPPASPPRNKPLLRPAFSTLQQHYSPAKSLAPKPLTATYLAPPSPSKLPTNVALSAETSRLQTELLQLHLLHRDLPSVTASWHASARSRLSARHADLGRSSRELSAMESDAAERVNVAALREWDATPPSGSRLTLEEKIQRLDALLASLWSLDAPGGKHNRLVRAFERWASTLSELEAARARADDADPSALLDANLEVRFGGGLDARWKDEASALVRRLEGWQAQLQEMQFPGNDADDEQTQPQVSSLKRMLDGCGSLVRDMLAELAVMEDIEAAAVERETEWIKQMNRQGDDGRGSDTPRAGAIWRVI
ncbi:hypothetical protein CPLU01_02810 [Colletotrichum plurivorum]|uniref:Aga1 a-agglutinin anchor subunit n=1 Tax=Colletotrichum plurivorum TaxID=2175906 RepID=A0A8H6KUJ3_9PEZI|nr:hypothetical protein CPLU01_02810 [Colletotrichum plurivorum]